ncbi:MAG: RraA family protein [Streptosporangiaceae bacterium]
MNLAERLTRLGTATVSEAAGGGVIDVDLIQSVPGSKVAGPARTVLCGQGDNLMVHAAMKLVAPGEVLVLTMPSPAPVALFGELLGIQSKVRGVAGVLVDAAMRDVDDLSALGILVWARWVRVTGASKATWGRTGVPITFGGTEIRDGDQVVLDRDGGVVVPGGRADEVLAAAERRAAAEAEKRALYRSGVLSIDRLDLAGDLPEGSPGKADGP